MAHNHATPATSTSLVAFNSSLQDKWKCWASIFLCDVCKVALVKISFNYYNYVPVTNTSDTRSTHSVCEEKRGGVSWFRWWWMMANDHNTVMGAIRKRHTFSKAPSHEWPQCDERCLGSWIRTFSTGTGAPQPPRLLVTVPIHTNNGHERRGSRTLRY